VNALMHEHGCETCGARRVCSATVCRGQIGRHCWACIEEGREITPFMIDVLCAFDSAAGVAHGTSVELYPHEGYLRLCGVPFAPLGWDEMARFAAGADDEIMGDIRRDLASFREDVERRLATRGASGSIWEPRP
jgi:hypothetical protein